MSSLRPGGAVFDPVAASQQLGDLTTGKVHKQFVKKSLYILCVFHQDERLTITVSVHTPVITQVNVSPSLPCHHLDTISAFSAPSICDTCVCGARRLAPEQQFVQVIILIIIIIPRKLEYKEW